MTGTVSRRGWGRILGVLACADRNARCQPNTSAMGDSYNALALTNLSGSAARVVAESVTRQDFGGGGR